jgi:uncharacterized protein involved in exopolysaccharide biosynthesis
MEDYFKSKNIIDILIRWKIHLATVVIVAALVAAFFSSSIFITPLFKSYSVVYPSNISPYSDESETEQMIQILQSKDIRDSLIRKFDLPRHYGIDPNYKFYMSTLLWEFGQKVKISKTPYSAVSIEVLDKDPKFACDMVNEIMHQYTLKIRYMHKEKFFEVVKNYQQITDYKKQELDSLQMTARELGLNFGLLDYQAQTREVTRALLSGGAGNRAEAHKLRKNLEEKGGHRELISDLMEHEAEDYSKLKLDYDRAVLDYNRNYTYMSILNKPFPADKKSYPVRWIIVVVSAMASLFLAIIVIGVIESRRTRPIPVPEIQKKI